ncbi:hypothetical protein ACFOD9_09215 [Novosphingobium bradum]|uniref:Thioesterase domain-containing protein n=1 Tax=Novosphingobium bradum TaxID=1737444 RepID=A0ABV7IT81_9SPHN
MIKDIRELAHDKAAYARELERRWSGLLSYRYIGRNHGSLNAGPVDNTVTLRRDMRNAAGGLLVSPLSISAPECGGQTDLESVPNPVIHSCQILDPGIGVKRIEVVASHCLKQGTRLGFSRSRIVDADNPARVLALMEGQGAIIGRPPEGLGKMPENRLEVLDSPDLPPLWQVFGAQRESAGVWTLPELSPDMASPDAALHMGPQHIALEAAAIDLAARLAGTDRLQMESWHVMFLARGKRGPFRLTGEAWPGSEGKLGVRVDLVDAGDGGRAVTTASAVMRRAD